MTKAVVPALMLLAIFFNLFGCSYRLGTTNSSQGTLHLVVRNDSLAPQLGSLVDQEIRKYLLRFGQYKIIKARKEADFFLKVTLKSYEKFPESYRAEDTLLASGFRMSIQADLELSSKHGSVLLESTSNGSSSVFREDISTLPRKKQAMQALASDLAYQVSLSLLNAAL